MSLETPNAFADEENILLHTALFKQVSPAEAEELLPHLKHATFDKGDYIFSEGDTDQRMYLLEQGRVKLIRTLLAIIDQYKHKRLQKIVQYQLR